MLTAELQHYESPNVTFVSPDLPIFWREALGSNVLDVDGNIYVDLTAGFGAVVSGHRNPGITETVRQQLFRLHHGLADVHPPQIKVKLLKRLSQIAPEPLSVTLLATTGAEAVEAALKTARLASGAPGVVCFSGAYHGLTYGALSITDRDHFKAPFVDQLGIPTLRAPYPDPFRPDPHLAGAAAYDAVDLGQAAVGWLDSQLDQPRDTRFGAVIVEPILGRGGVVIPPDGFLSALRDLCDRRGLVLIFDEILTGFARTGNWFACQHEDVVPDLLCIGKAFGGSLPFSACIGRPETMAAWPASSGEAIHTSTFLGHPLGCSAALAQIEQISSTRLVARSERLGELVLRDLEKLRGRFGVGDVRGRGLLIGVDVVTDLESLTPDPERAYSVVVNALRRGLLLTAGGPACNVLTLTPPLTITDDQLAFALQTLEDCFADS